MATAIGVNSTCRFKRQTVKGTLAGASLGQILRRESAVFELKKETYTTESEITSTQQLLSSRHGARSVDGKITGILSPGTYSDMMAAALRQDFAAITPVSGVAITISGAGPTYTVARATGSWLTDGIKIGQVVRLSGGTLNAANSAKNLLVTAIASATSMTVMVVNRSSLVAEGPISACTVTATGEVSFTPITGHTNVYYTVEIYDPDVPSSERNQDCKVSALNLSLPGSGVAKIDISMLGLDQTSDTAAYFSAPTAETTTGALVASSGLLIAASGAVATVTDLSINIDTKEQLADPVVGSPIRPDIFRGKVMVQGSFTGYFDSNTMADNFRNETSISIISVMATDNSPTAKFMSLVLAAVDVNSVTPTDGETGKKRTYSFICEFNSAGGAGTATEKTTLYVQDSDA